MLERLTKRLVPIGKAHRWLCWPILGLCLCIALTTLPMNAFAAEGTAETDQTTCAHIHEETVGGYVAPADESPCTHMHDETCGGLATAEPNADLDAPTVGKFEGEYSCIYGNGNPLVIEAGTTEDYTNVYWDKNDNQQKDGDEEWLKSEDGEPTAAGYDLSEMTFCGGSSDQDIFANPKITMLGGKVGYIYGGGETGAVTGNTTVTVSGGLVVGTVYGGGYKGAVNGNTSVILNGNAVTENTIHGGGEAGAVSGNSSVTIDGGTVGYVTYGGGNTGAVTGNSSVTVGDGTVRDCIYGGGGGAATGSSSITVTGGTVAYIFGGGDASEVLGDSTITITGGSVNQLRKGKVTGTFGLTVGGTAKIANLSLCNEGGTSGITNFAVSPALTGDGMVDIDIEKGYDATGNPTVITGATAADMSRIRMFNDIADHFTLSLVDSAVKLAPIQLATPTNLRWDSASPGLLSWDAVERAAEYHLILYKDGEETELSGAYPYTTTNCDSMMAELGAGSYTVTVQAKTERKSVLGVDSAVATSPAYTYTTYVVSGEVVTDAEVPVPVVSATIKLMRGSNSVGTTTTGDDGKFSIADVSNGVYNLVISNEGVTKTTVVVVKDANKDVGKITLPTDKLNTVVEVGSSVPDIVVDGLSDQISDADREYAKNSNNSVEIKLAVKKLQYNDEVVAVVTKIEEDGLERVAGFDLSLAKIMTGATTSTEAMKVATSLLTLRVPLPSEALDKTGHKVYRYHDSKVDVLTTAANSDGEKIEVVGTTLILTVKKFSVYAIAYTPEGYTPPIVPDAPSDSGGNSTPSYRPNVSKTEGGTVLLSHAAPSKGQTVTITTKPDEGYVVETITVTGSNGKTVVVTKGQDGLYTFLQPSGKVTITVTFVPAESRPAWGAFIDVSERDWFYDGVKYIYEKGLMDGTAADKFNPSQNASRGMIVTILWRLEGEPTSKGTSSFADASADGYDAAAIAWAAENGIVMGYGNGTFGSADPITREQLAAILHRYVQVKGTQRPSEGMDIGNFSDSGAVSTWARDAMRWALGKGIVSGKGNDILDPKGSATRAETAAMLARFLKEADQ